MFRMLFSICLSVVVARWSYSEIKMMWPGAIPLIDYALEKAEIPTHDQWASSMLGRFLIDVAQKQGVQLDKSGVSTVSRSGSNHTPASVSHNSDFKQIGATVIRSFAQLKRV
ncbi:MAG: hypothetical protein K1X79_10625 [Oligoflexia bacterium]|nr:hypothetical protein [Oligoflexia bacterium]